MSKWPLAAHGTIANRRDQRHTAEYGKNVSPRHFFHQHGDGEGNDTQRHNLEDTYHVVHVSDQEPEQEIRTKQVIGLPQPVNEGVGRTPEDGVDDNVRNYEGNQALVDRVQLANTHLTTQYDPSPSGQH